MVGDTPQQSRTPPRSSVDENGCTPCPWARQGTSEETARANENNLLGRLFGFTSGLINEWDRNLIRSVQPQSLEKCFYHFPHAEEQIIDLFTCRVADLVVIT